jgi:hypothetical protein
MSDAADLREEIAALREDLARQFAQFAGALELSDELWSFRPAEKSWSASEIAEHVALANRYLLILADKIAVAARRRFERGETIPQGPLGLERLQSIARSDFRWPHPAHMAPTGAVPRADIEAELARQRAQCLALLDGMPAGEGRLHQIRMSVLGEGERLDLYGYLAFLGLHVARHAQQIERNRLAWESTRGDRPSPPPGSGRRR